MWMIDSLFSIEMPLSNQTRTLKDRTLRMRILIKEIDLYRTTRIEFDNDDVEQGLEIVFSSPSVQGKATLWSYEVALREGRLRVGAEMEVAPDFLSVSGFQRTPGRAAAITAIGNRSDYRVVGYVGDVDPFGGRDIGVVANEFIFSIDERIVPMQGWAHLVEGDWVEFKGHHLLFSV